MQIESTSFENSQNIPSKFTCDGEDINPAFTIKNLPDNTKTVALIVDDPDAPSGSANPGWVHWVVYNINPEQIEIPEYTKQLGMPGINDWGKTGYGGPCPPSGQHSYVFSFYALNGALAFDDYPTKSQLVEAMDGHIIETATIIGLYSRS